MDFESARLDKVIRRLYGKNIPQSVIEKAIRNKDILVNGQKVSSSTQVSDKDDIYVHESFKKYSNNIKKPITLDKTQFKAMIIYEDNNIIAINKPSGLAVQLGTNTQLSVDIMAKSYNPELRLVHRIDKDTSGITILSKNVKISRFMLYMFKNRKIHKRYLAIVSSKNLLENHGVIDVPISKNKDKVCIDKENGREAVTEYTLVKKLNNDLALVSLLPKTGRTHQIRVHLQYIGCPILGDKKYAGRSYKKLCLHSSTVSFMDINGRQVNIKADIPAHISQLINSARD